MSDSSLSARLRARGALLCALVALAGAALVTPGCGKKGPPLAPLLRLPGAVQEFTAHRLGETVYVQFTVPAKNQDTSIPADVARVEVYGFTGKPADNDEIVKYGTLVGSVPVRRPPPEEEDRRRSRDPGQKMEPKKKPVEVEPGFDQGAKVTITETLTAALMQPVVVKRRAARREEVAVEGPITLAEATFQDVPARVYVAVGVNHKGQRGVFSPRAPVPIVPPPAPPGDVKASHSESAIFIQWTPPPGVPVVAVREKDAPYLAGKPVPTVVTPKWTYDVYEVPAPGAADGSKSAEAGPTPTLPAVDTPVPLNADPVTLTAYKDPHVEFGTQRCYVVRTVAGYGALREQSEPSSVVCITPRDIYPPAVPKGLVAVASAGVMSLNWEPVTDSDLAGYLVLRAEAPGGTLQRVTSEPLQGTTYEDRTVKAGIRYVYAVVAVDKTGNVSKESNHIEEIAR